MDVTSRFVLDFAVRYAAEHAGARILDYGCGAGAVVEAGLAAGLDIGGAVTADGDVGEFDAEFQQAVGDPWAVAVLNPSRQHFGTGDYNSRAHAHRLEDYAGRATPRATSGVSRK